MFFDAGILHRDISPMNTLYCRNPIPIESVAITHHCKGALLPSGAHGPMGTYLCMAINLLEGTCLHRYRHDWRAFFVLIWVACYPKTAPPPRSTTTSLPSSSAFHISSKSNTHPEPASYNPIDLIGRHIVCPPGHSRYPIDQPPTVPDRLGARY